MFITYYGYNISIYMNLADRPEKWQKNNSSLIPKAAVIYVSVPCSVQNSTRPPARTGS